MRDNGSWNNKRNRARRKGQHHRNLKIAALACSLRTHRDKLENVTTVETLKAEIAVKEGGSAERLRESTLRTACKVQGYKIFFRTYLRSFPHWSQLLPSILNGVRLYRMWRPLIGEVLSYFRSSGYHLGCTIAAVIAHQLVEHVKNALQNIMAERMPQSVEVRQLMRSVFAGQNRGTYKRGSL